MPATGTQPFNGSPAPSKTPLITWEQFQRKYLDREDRWKYEWVRGIVQKTPRTMNQSQQFLFINLLNLLDSLRLQEPGIGRLLPEVDTRFKEFHRRPDISYFSKKQIPLMSKQDQIPQFVIEIISTNDQINLVHEKMEDYRSVGIPVIWQIFPKLRTVHEYRGKHMTILTGDDVCSAEPVIPGFKITVSEILQQ